MSRQDQSVKLLTFFLIATGNLGFGQTTITLQPGPSQGKDALVWSLNPNSNYGSTVEFTIYAWTNGGIPAVRRCFVDFDLSSIPSGATILYAGLTLYNDSNSSSTNGAHSQLSGSNELVVQRVIEPWDEQTITWNDQPMTASQDQIIVPASSSPHQDYLIDVTGMTQEMLTDPTNNFGFCFKLQTEQYYRSLIFASSDIADTTLHPKLTITYTLPTGINANVNAMVEISTYPNPFSEFLTVDIGADQDLYPLTIELTNTLGEIVRRSTIGSSSFTMERNDLPPGSYVLSIYSEGMLIGAKNIVAQ